MWKMEGRGQSQKISIVSVVLHLTVPEGEFLFILISLETCLKSEKETEISAPTEHSIRERSDA